MKLRVRELGQNDFGFAEFDASGRVVQGPTKSELWVIRLPEPLR